MDLLCSIWLALSYPPCCDSPQFEVYQPLPFIRRQYLKLLIPPSKPFQKYCMFDILITWRQILSSDLANPLIKALIQRLYSATFFTTSWSFQLNTLSRFLYIINIYFHNMAPHNVFWFILLLNRGYIISTKGAYTSKIFLWTKDKKIAAPPCSLAQNSNILLSNSTFLFPGEP